MIYYLRKRPLHQSKAELHNNGRDDGEDGEDDGEEGWDDLLLEDEDDSVQTAGMDTEFNSE